MNFRTWSRVLPYLIAAGLAFWFTAENAATWVWVDLILFQVRLSLPLLVFLSILLGMMIVFLVGIRSDLRTRRMLERYRMAVDLAPAEDGRDDAWEDPYRVDQSPKSSEPTPSGELSRPGERAPGEPTL